MKFHFRVLLLQQVMAATDADAEEESIFGAGGSKASVKRQAGNMASMSGADDNRYTEFKKSKTHHPLFKKFRAMRSK